MSDEPLFTVAVGERYNATKPSKGVWRMRARDVIVATISEVQLDLGTAKITRKEALAFIDDAYPFGERAMAPYKAWLAERKLFIEAFDEPARDVTDPPDADELAVIEVAADLVEEQREDEAVALLEAQAPRRLARPCPACNTRAGYPCSVIGNEPTARQLAGKASGRIIPHTARLVPPAPTSGPLFGDRA